MLEIPSSLWSLPNRLIAAFVLLTLKPLTPSFWGGFSLTLLRNITYVVLIVDNPRLPRGLVRMS